MKTVKQMRLTNNDNLIVLIEEKEEGRAYVDYFLNNTIVTDWALLTKEQRSGFTILADEICDQFNLLKWSY